ncbi:MAG: proton-conducting transporter membrane subunit [Planctomycetota bacterium]
MALLGSFFLAYSALHAGLESTLFFDELIALAPRLSRPWLHAAFVFLLVGYGTKMGLAPLHTWKPEAYGEAPGMIGALLAGGLTNCAFLAILRFHQVCVAAGDANYSRQQMIFLGLFSMGVAAFSMVRQMDFKKLLAFSSVEHMGILVLGIGIGGEAVFGSLLHVLNNGLTKGVLFLSAGNIHRVYGSKLAHDVQGALRRVPMSASLFLMAFIAVTGSPPFGPFLSRFTIVSTAFLKGYLVTGVLFLVFLFIAFTGFGARRPADGSRPTVSQGERDGDPGFLSHRCSRRHVDGIGARFGNLLAAGAREPVAKRRRVPRGVGRRGIECSSRQPAMNRVPLTTNGTLDC